MEIKTKESAISARDVIADHLSPIGDPAQKGRYLYHADAILSALAEAGLVIAPRVPTPEMLKPFAEVYCRWCGIDPDAPQRPHGEYPNWYEPCGYFTEAFEKMVDAAG